MANDDCIRIEGTVVDVLQPRLFRVQLANGHRLLAHVSGKVRLQFMKIGAGDRVTVEMSPYDLSRGRIAVPTI
ncbi:MAG TPA: translation initiation factor IF-1 [Verrucomicrobiales bacterium]|nr:translation initiation factor IF-1 [Verrucomicrobiales bacterium]